MKEFNDVVIQKNEFIKAYYPNYHAWGSDRREFLEAFYLSSLADIQASFDRNTELINENWSDETERQEFFDKLGKYFTGKHGDFIYNNVPELVK